MPVLKFIANTEVYALGGGDTIHGDLTAGELITAVKKLKAAKDALPPTPVTEHLYINADEIKLRLHSTIVRWNSRPVMAYYTGDDHSIKIVDLLTMAKQIVSTDDPRLDITSVPLGYCNSQPNCYYLARSSAREQKQGVYLSSLRATNTNGTVQTGLDLDHKAVGQMILGEYPTFGGAMDTLNSGSSGCAFSRHLAIAKLKSHLVIWARGHALGVYDPKGYCMLSPAFERLPIVAELKKVMEINVVH